MLNLSQVQKTISQQQSQQQDQTKQVVLNAKVSSVVTIY
jgi:hypothetical protein